MVYVSGQISSMLGDSFIASSATIICMNDRNQLNSQLRVGIAQISRVVRQKV